MKKTTTLLLISILCLCAFKPKPKPVDDTAYLQSLLGANATLPSGHGTYNFSSMLTLTHNFNGNGNTLHYTGATGAAIKMNANGIKLENTTLTGTGSALNISGNYGISMNAANDTVYRCRIDNFTSYGISGGDYDGATILNSKITRTYYIGVFLCSTNTHAVKGGTVAFDTIDRSTQAPATITQGALMIRGGTNLNYPSSGWDVHHNVLSMPYKPTDWTAEPCEMRYTPNSFFWNNTLIQGSISISIVRSDYVQVMNNMITSPGVEGIEYADSKYGWCVNNTVKNSAGHGILVDGFPGFGNYGHKFLNNILLNSHDNGIQIFGLSSNIDIINCTISNASKGIYIQSGAYGVNVYTCNIDGVGHANYGVVLDGSKGNVNVVGCSFKNITSKAFQIYNHPPSGQTLKTDNVVFTGSTFLNIPSGYTTDLGTGGTVGTNISLH